MGFRGKVALTATIVLLWGSAAVAQITDLKEIVVIMQDDTGMASSVRRRAERDVSAVLRAAGVQVVWINCQKGSHDNDCGHVLEPSEFEIHIVPTGKTRNELVFGEAFLGENGSGKYADIFLQRIEEAEGASGVDLSRLLGAVCAHELGHLLLGSQAHSAAGIMQPIWKRDALVKIGMGLMLFTREESRMMRERLGRARLVLSSIRVPNRSTADGW
jgi:hypothetical protein